MPLDYTIGPLQIPIAPGNQSDELLASTPRCHVLFAHSVTGLPSPGKVTGPDAVDVQMECRRDLVTLPI